MHLTREEIENLRGRFFLQLDRPSDGCWPWTGPRHSSGAGRTCGERRMEATIDTSAPIDLRITCRLVSFPRTFGTCAGTGVLQGLSLVD